MEGEQSKKKEGGSNLKQMEKLTLNYCFISGPMQVSDMPFCPPSPCPVRRKTQRDPARKKEPSPNWTYRGVKGPQTRQAVKASSLLFPPTSPVGDEREGKLQPQCFVRPSPSRPCLNEASGCGADHNGEGTAINQEISSGSEEKICGKMRVTQLSPTSLPQPLPHRMRR